MKNVLVLRSKNFSVDFLRTLSLKSSNSQNIDSTYIFEENEHDKGSVASILEGLQTKDEEIQFFHFYSKAPRDDRNQNVTKNNLEYWVEKLKDMLAEKGETIDAVVIPHGYGTESKIVVDWLEEMKKEFPNIKVLVEYPEKGMPLISDKDKDGDDFPRYVRAKTEYPERKSEDEPHFHKAVLTQNNQQGFELHPVVDMATVGAGKSGYGFEKAMRKFLGVKELDTASLRIGSDKRNSGLNF